MLKNISQRHRSLVWYLNRYLWTICQVLILEPIPLNNMSGVDTWTDTSEQHVRCRYLNRYLWITCQMLILEPIPLNNMSGVDTWTDTSEQDVRCCTLTNRYLRTTCQVLHTDINRYLRTTCQALHTDIKRYLRKTRQVLHTDIDWYLRTTCQVFILEPIPPNNMSGVDTWTDTSKQHVRYYTLT
jgi:hypothetical protein